MVRFFISLVLILYTVSVIESLKGGKMFKTVGIVESKRNSVFNLVIKGLKPVIRQKIDIGSIRPKKILFW